MQTVNAPALLSRRTVETLTSISRATLYRLMKTGEFPSPVKVSAGRVAWREADVRGWIESRKPN